MTGWQSGKPSWNEKAAFKMEEDDWEDWPEVDWESWPGIDEDWPDFDSIEWPEVDWEEWDKLEPGPNTEIIETVIKNIRLE